MLCPSPLPLFRRLCNNNAILDHVLDEIRHPSDGIFDRPWNVAEHLMRSHNVIQIREIMHRQPQIRLNPIRPLIRQFLASNATDIDSAEGPSDCVESRRVDDDIELEIRVCRSDATLMDAFNRILVNIDERYIRLIESFVVAAFKWDASCAEAVVLGDQFFGHGWVVDALPDLVRYEIAEQLVGCRVGVDVVEVAKPLAETWGVVECFPVSFALFGTDAEDRGGVGFVDEAGVGVEAVLEDGWVVSPDVFHVCG